MNDNFKLLDQHFDKGKRKWFLAQNHCSLKNDQIFLEPLMLGFFLKIIN